MKPPDCPRLTRDIATLRALYPHLTKRDIKQMRTYHSCGDCHPLPEHLSREPRRTDQP